MNKMTKWLGLATAGLLLAACASDGGETAESTGTEGSSTTGGGTNQVTVWAWDPAFNLKALELAEEVYTADNPDFELNVIENAQDDIVQKLNTSLSSGTTKGMPNIVLIEDYRIQSFLEAYPESFYPVTDLLNADDFADYKVTAGTVEDEVYTVPFDSGVTGLYVRTDILEEAGYSVEDLTDITWEEYVTIGKDVTEKTGVKFVTSDHNDLGLIRTMIQTAGKWYTAEDGTTPDIADNEALKSAFKVYKGMVDGGMMNVHSDWSQLVSAVNTGAVATAPTGNWFTPSIKQAADQSGKWAVVPYPRLDIEGSVNASNLGGSSWYVLNVDGKEAAADFLIETFGSSDELYQTLVEEIGAIGAFGPAAEGDAYKMEDEFFGGQAVYQDFSAWITEIPQVNFGQNTYAIEDIMVVAMQEYLNGGDLDEILANAQTQAETQIQ
ncbi:MULTISPECIES: ABC transporter substrate-binding protein [unclassified Jeotgalibaca]|uniref:ABC transporter substrate-binding protein n=1 Tax=unclassified Jeotgalibaca TaxID=2621505 RepID=UPI003FD67E1E